MPSLHFEIEHFHCSASEIDLAIAGGSRSGTLAANERRILQPVVYLCRPHLRRVSEPEQLWPCLVLAATQLAQPTIFDARQPLTVMDQRIRRSVERSPHQRCLADAIWTSVGASTAIPRRAGCPKAVPVAAPWPALRTPRAGLPFARRIATTVHGSRDAQRSTSRWLFPGPASGDHRPTRQIPFSHELTYRPRFRLPRRL